MSQKTSNIEELRGLPSIDALLQTEAAKSLRQAMGAEQLTWLARRVTDELRQEILGRNSESISPGPDAARAALLKEAERRLVTAHESELASRMRSVINATGVILHTNLGRAPLSEAARRAVTEVASGYCALEYDVAGGTRGRRGARAEDLLAQLTGAEAALIVNNCAAAALLVLTVLARDGETIVSRGELVEIGGDFRVPDVMAQSGTRMIEVGTTNRTRLSDYRKALSEQTRLIMRVHTSNYRIVGFTKTPSLRELTDLAHDAGLILYEDAGSGALVDFSKYEITGEPVIRASIADGTDVVSFSGDKLVGGPQAGLIVGRAALIERMRSHPLYRALRADKLRYAALEATLDAYARGASTDEVPVHRLIAASFEEIEKRAEALIQRLRLAKVNGALRTETVTGESAIGGGSAPTSRLPTTLISLTHDVLTPNQIETALRHSNPPIIARIVDDRVLLDLRTVFPSQESAIEAAVLSFSS
ncbi:MAG TPA: L-seryl-tRNA(Sec) selenium transferase [Pyrinomonadaceae bacterium]|nr:L-seryl-tRNA(Sec) selenium transferase [Pyrinomonadaceae bacterium]